MCLFVSDSFVKNPIFEQECIKVLVFEFGMWFTPYQYNEVPTDGTGWFMPKRPSRRNVREFYINDRIYGGFIHAHQTLNQAGFEKALNDLPKNPTEDTEYAFRAIARFVVAHETNRDLVCKALYIPAFDATRAHRDAQLILK